MSVRYALLPLLVLSLLLLAPARSRAQEETPPDGPGLYAMYCASCHQPLDRALLQGRTLRRIRSSIQHLAVMSHLRHLDDEVLGAIAATLAFPDGEGAEKGPSPQL